MHRKWLNYLHIMCLELPLCSYKQNIKLHYQQISPYPSHDFTITWLRIKAANSHQRFLLCNKYKTRLFQVGETIQIELHYVKHQTQTHVSTGEATHIIQHV